MSKTSWNVHSAVFKDIETIEIEQNIGYGFLDSLWTIVKSCRKKGISVLFL